MPSKDVVFLFEIVLNENYCNDAAKEFIPELIKDCARQVMLKSALLATPKAVTLSATVSSYPDYAVERLDLGLEPTLEGNDGNSEKGD